MDETPLIQQYLQLRSEFMGYLYAMTSAFPGNRGLTPGCL